jgi:hypothetical protein
LYEFATYSGAKVIGLDVTDDNIQIRLENNVYQLDIALGKVTDHI